MEQTIHQIMYKNTFSNSNNSNNSLYWKPQIDFQHTLNQKKNNDLQLNDHKDYSSIKKDMTSRNSSFKMSTKKINGNQMNNGTTNKIQRKRHDP